MFIQQIKDVVRDIESRTIDDMILAKNSLVALNVGYEDNLIDPPKWVINGITALTRQISAKCEAQLLLALEKLESQQEADASRKERTDKRATQIAALKEKLKR